MPKSGKKPVYGGNERKTLMRPWVCADSSNGGQATPGSDSASRGRKKRMRRSTGGSSVNTQPGAKPISSDSTAVTKIQFKNMSTDDKLTTLFDMMVHVQSVFTQAERTLYTVNANTQDIDENTRRIKVLEYKSIDLESRSRRNNLIFRGIEETFEENCESKALSFIQDKLQIDTSTIKIQRAHRIGKRTRGSNKSRPLIVCFLEFSHTTEVLSKCFKLRNTNYSVSRDYPQEIMSARSKLWPFFKAAKQSNPKGSVRLVYPAKLVVNGRTTHDEFPDWSDVMSGLRIGPTTYARPEPAPDQVTQQAQQLDPRVTTYLDSTIDGSSDDESAIEEETQDSQSILNPPTDTRTTMSKSSCNS